MSHFELDTEDIRENKTEMAPASWNLHSSLESADEGGDI